MAYAVRQDEKLQAQALQILQLTEQYSAKMQQTDDAHQHAVELQPQTRADPSVTFRELTARIDKAVRDGIHSEQLTKSSVGRQTKPPHSVHRHQLQQRTSHLLQIALGAPSLRNKI